jgi:hypothetical protein
LGGFDSRALPPKGFREVGDAPSSTPGHPGADDSADESSAGGSPTPPAAPRDRALVALAEQIAALVAAGDFDAAEALTRAARALRPRDATHPASSVGASEADDGDAERGKVVSLAAERERRERGDG